MAEMTEKEEKKVLELITSAGGAKSTFMEALYKAKDGEYEESAKLLEQGNEYFLQGHQAHVAMLASESNGVEMSVRLILAHAEDQLMSAELIKTMVEELIELYKMKDVLEKKVAALEAALTYGGK